MQIADGRTRVIIENVSPEIDGGRFPIKRVPGESVNAEADIYTDGHDAVSAVICYREPGDHDWHEVPFQPLVNDRWSAEFTLRHIGLAHYTIVAWVDHFKSWTRDLYKRLDAAEDVTRHTDERSGAAEELSVQRIIGARLIEDAAHHAPADGAGMLRDYARRVRDESEPPDVAFEPLLAELMFRYAERRYATTYPHELTVSVDRTRARFSSWYELFPRSMSPDPGEHGTLKDVENYLPRLAEMGFDVVYLPPIHPIGRTHRKGPNNAAPPPENPKLYYDQGHPGSPWAIGSEEGGHKSIHPELGTVADFKSLVGTARQLGIDIALDLAYQCSPDHPYVKEHPQWFRQRPDGTIQYAENPPKKYQDIYPFDFETDDWEALWYELESIIRYWIDLGVRIFRVDNPHTKSFHFWEWAIGRLKGEHPDLIFLAEAFTRPKVMYYLAKLGFNQSYTYYAWRNTRWELTEYMVELTQTEVADYFRPNFWPNTPDILTEFLQMDGRPAFMQRLALAATLTASYGIYGPAYELCENVAVEPGKEEYLDSEKYEIRQRSLDQPGALGDFIATINHIRHDNPALQSNDSIMFHHTDNDQLIAYTKHTESLDNIVLTVVNLDPQHVQAGWLDLPLDLFGIDEQQSYLLEDVLNGHRYLWHGSRNYVELNPHITPAHIFRVRRRMRTERDFDYFS